MAASDDLLSSTLLRLYVSFDGADGDVGLRSFAASFLLVNGAMPVDQHIFLFCLYSGAQGVLMGDVPSPLTEAPASCPSCEVPALGGSVTLILGKRSAMLVLTLQDVSWVYLVAMRRSWEFSWQCNCESGDFFCSADELSWADCNTTTQYEAHGRKPVGECRCGILRK
jgi:hypothetical protein